MTRPILTIVALALVAGCAGAPVEQGSNPMDWGPGADNMDPEERAQMSACTEYATWSYCKRQMLGPGF